jgi:hypothetical protein
VAVVVVELLQRELVVLVAVLAFWGQDVLALVAQPMVVVVVAGLAVSLVEHQPMFLLKMVAHMVVAGVVAGEMVDHLHRVQMEQFGLSGPATHVHSHQLVREIYK